MIIDTCSLELARELKELNVPQRSLFYWEFLSEDAYSVQYSPYTVYPLDVAPYQHFSAYNPSELMNMLPAYIDKELDEPFNIFYFQLYKRSARNIQYMVNYVCDTQQVTQDGCEIHANLFNHNVYDENLANCLAKTLIRILKYYKKPILAVHGVA